MNVQSRSNRFVVGAALLTLAAWSPIGGSSNSAAAEGGGSITFGVPWEVDSFDPTFSTQRVGRLVFKNMCESLFGVDDQLEVYPVLAAEMPDISDDGLSMTIPLRSGLRFSDATEFDAEAVKVSLERHMTAEGSRRASELFFLDSVEVVDDLTVKLNLKEPFVPAAAVLADRSGTIMSPTRLAELNDEFGSAPSCVAPFKFAEWSQGNFFALERDPEYYAADSVAIDRVVFRLIEDASIRMANLRTGEVDMTEVSHRDIAQIEADDSLALLSTDSVGWLDIWINIGHPDGPPDTALASDVRIREAFELTLDRAQLNQLIYGGTRNIVCTSIFEPSVWAVPAYKDCPQRDVERSRELLEEAGATPPVQVDLMIYSDTDSVRAGELIQTMAAGGGFDVKLHVVDFATAIKEAIDGNYDAAPIGHSGRVDPHENTWQHHHSKGVFNWMGNSDPELDAMIDEAKSIVDFEERRAAYAEIVARIQKQHSQIYLLQDRILIGARAEVTGFEPSPDGLWDLKRVKLSN
jgi:peptide/nickel transport system substrate-binding protein